MTNMNKANETRINGNCKAVRDITNNIRYNSVMEAAKANGVSSATMSVAINRKYVCNGYRFMFEKELHENTDELCAQLAKANMRVAKATATREEMAEFYQWKAEREAEAKRQEAIRKAKEDHAKAITKAREKATRIEAEVERRKARLKLAEDKLMAAQIELEALMDEEINVVDAREFLNYVGSHLVENGGNVGRWEIRFEYLEKWLKEYEEE